jgi:hypothetical protein
VITSRRSLASPEASPSTLFSPLSESYLEFKSNYEMTLRTALSNSTNETDLSCLQDSLGQFLSTLPVSSLLFDAELSRQDRFPESLELLKSLSKISEIPSTPSLSFRPSRYPSPSPAASVNSLDTFEQRQTTPLLTYRRTLEQQSHLDHPTQEFYEELESPEILVGGESQLNRFTSLEPEPRKIFDGDRDSPQSVSMKEVSTSSKSHVTLRSHSRQHHTSPPSCVPSVEPTSFTTEPPPEEPEDSQETQSAIPFEEVLQLSQPPPAVSIPPPAAVTAPSTTNTTSSSAPVPPARAPEILQQSEPKPNPPKAKRIASKDHSILVAEKKRDAKTLLSKETAKSAPDPLPKTAAPEVAAPKRLTNLKTSKANAKAPIVASPSSSSSSSSSDSESSSGSDSDSDGSSSGSDSSSEEDAETQPADVAAPVGISPAATVKTSAPPVAGAVPSVSVPLPVSTSVTAEPTISQSSTSASQESSGSDSDSSSSSGSSGSSSDSSDSDSDSGSSESSESSSDEEEPPKSKPVQKSGAALPLPPTTPLPSRSVRFSEKSPVAVKIEREDTSEESDAEAQSQSDFQTPSKDTLKVTSPLYSLLTLYHSPRDCCSSLQSSNLRVRFSSEKV